MESSRDSSVWRNLAVTFGGGLALGAVGMKLTQTALRPADAPPRQDSGPVAGRLSEVERRLEQIEHQPAPARAAAPAPTAAASIDQKVLEAVIGAVDARLHEYAGQVDRRLADMEARLAVMQGQQQQDRQQAQQLRDEGVALRSALQSDLRQMRESRAHAIAGQSVLHSDLQTVRQQLERNAAAGEQRFAGIWQELRQEMAQLRSDVERSAEARAVTAAAATVAAQMEERIAPLRAEVERKEQELVELRRRLAESENGVLDVVLAIGDVCRQAAERMGGPRQPQPVASLLPVPAPATESHAYPEAAGPAPPETPAKPMLAPVPKVETMPAPQGTTGAALAPSIPDFAPENRASGAWRIPLVSSLLVCTGYLCLMHYLVLPLQ